MTYNEWEGALLGYLKSLSDSEKREITEYYKEMYGDRSEAGMSPDEILAEFGEPKLCAARILTESADYTTDEAAAEPQESVKEKSESLGKRTAPPISPTLKPSPISVTVSKVIGLVLLTVLVFIPLAAIIISAVAAFAAVTVGGAGMVIGGAIIAIAAPFGLIGGYTGLSMLGTVGVGLATAGIGAIIFVIFFIITKYSVVACVKLLKHFIERKRRI